MGSNIKVSAIYARVSSKSQSLDAQLPDLEMWEKTHVGTPVKWYRDQFTGKTFKRPGMEELLRDVEAHKVDRIVFWRLDRIGRNARSMLDFFERCRELKVRIESIREGIADLESPAGRMLLMMLASFAEYETEVRSERQRAGMAANLARQKEVQALARQGQSAEFIALTRKIPVEKVRKMLAAGDRPWWVIGRKPIEPSIKIGQVHRLIGAGLSLAETARALGVTTQTVRNCIRRWRESNPPELAETATH